MSVRNENDPEIRARQRWMAVLARATADEIEHRLVALPPLPSHTRLRGPETGLVMLRGRAGGAGAPFNLGEISVTRCTVQLDGGEVGHAYIRGRDLKLAELAATLDAALQRPERHDALETGVIQPLAQTQDASAEHSRRKAAATQVQFFAMTAMR